LEAGQGAAAVTVQMPGWVYILTPAAGTESQRGVLAAQGFKKTGDVESGELSLEITEPLVVMGKEAGRGDEISCGNWGIVLARVSPFFHRTLAKIRPVSPLNVNTWRKVVPGGELFRNQGYTFPNGIPWWLEGMPYLETNYGAVAIEVEEGGWLYIMASGNPSHHAKSQLEAAGFIEEAAFSKNGIGTGDPMYLMGKEVSAGESVSYNMYGIPIAAGVLGPANVALNTNLAEIILAAPKNVSAGKIVPDGKMFSDRDYLFPSALPEWITGVDYVQGALFNHVYHATKPGWLYIAAPADSATNNNAKVQLEGQGFTEITRFGPREFELAEAIAIMGREVQAGEYFYSHWGIPIAQLCPDSGAPVLDINNKALDPPDILRYPSKAEYQDGNRLWQGIPSIGRAPNGRLWEAWYSGGVTEDPWNWIVLYTSGDNGETWTGPAVVVDPPEYPVRAGDPGFWTDPNGRLWLFWFQSYFRYDARYGIWAMYTDNPGYANPTWSQPRRISHAGLALNKAIVLSDGTWMLPDPVFTNGGLGLFEDYVPPGMDIQNIDIHNLGDEVAPNVYVSTDEGATWTYRGGARNPPGMFTESMVVEQKDGKLRMLMRAEGWGIAESYSGDKGYTWSQKVNSGLTTVSARFHFARHPVTDNLILICNKPPSGNVRSHMTVFLSEDDGKTWPYSIVIDERVGVSYPDAVFDGAGNIYISYDRNRYSSMEILLAKITEADIKAGSVVNGGSFLQRIINNNQP
jgi:hypothetical protein